MVNFASLAATIVAVLMVAAGVTGTFSAQYKQKDNGNSHLYLYQSCNAQSGDCETYDKPASDDCTRKVYDRFTAALALGIVGSVLGVAVVIVSLVGICKQVPGLVGAMLDILCAASFITAFAIVADLYKLEFCPNILGQKTQYSKTYDYDLGFAFLIVAAGLAVICAILHAVICVVSPRG